MARLRQTLLLIFSEWRDLHRILEKQNHSMINAPIEKKLDSSVAGHLLFEDSQAIRRRDLAKVSKATASTMIMPIMICWM
jgi:hypothetical protein